MPIPAEELDRPPPSTRLRGILDGAHATAGHFRDHRRALKRGGGIPALSLDVELAEERCRLEPASEASPDRNYDRRCAVELLDRVLLRLSDEWAGQGKANLFEGLRGFLSDTRGSLSQAEVAARIGMSEVATRQAVHRLRTRYRELLREEVAQRVAPPHEVEEELRQLHLAFGSS